MVEYRRIKTKDGLTKEITTGEGVKIPETVASVRIHDDEDLSVTIVPQSSLTGDCWLVQFNGFESCVDCEEYLKPNCGGGATLAKMIIDHFKDSIMTKMRFNEYWGGSETEERKNFYNFVEWAKEKHAFRYSYNKYRRHIKQLRIIAAEPKGLNLDALYPFFEHFNQPNNKTVEQSGYHQHNQCECVKTTRKGSYRDVIISQFDETGAFLRRLCYYHQHCIYVEDKGLIYLSSCKHRTVTTKERLNRYLRNREVWSDGGVWYVGIRRWTWSPETGKGQTDYQEKTRFHDGMELVA